MAFDFKKEYREFYLPKDRPEVVTVPTMHYMAVRAWGIPTSREVPISRRYRCCIRWRTR